jgi:DNA-binding LytR/AlgR family response regulator
VKLRVVLIEDERHSRDRLRKLLAAFEDVEVVGEAEDGVSAVALIDECRPDLAFIDVQLPEISGFDVLGRVRHRPLVIFVTAFDRYAVRAFEERAVDYLLKPTAPERLAAALERVRQTRRPVDDALIAALQQLARPPRHVDQLSVRQGDSILLVPVAQILWCEARDGYVLIRSAAREYVSDLTLKELEEQLDPDRFLRIHRGVIVAIGSIAKVERSFGGRYGAKMRDTDGRRFEIGRAHLPAVRARLRF